jgi:DNA-binding CsgD family transcriptional regulator
MDIKAIGILLGQESDEVKISSFLACFCANLGCCWYRIGLRSVDCTEGEMTCLDNFPEAPNDEGRLAADAAWDDPRALESALHWRADAMPACAMPASAIPACAVQERKRGGIRAGVSVRASTECGVTSVFTLAADAHLAHEAAISIASTMRALHPHLLNPLRRLSETRVKKSLSARECEVLYWSAMGKTSWAIAKILNVSERTINFHIANSIDKLNAANRSHAVVKAVQIGVIHV